MNSVRTNVKFTETAVVQHFAFREHVILRTAMEYKRSSISICFRGTVTEHFRALEFDTDVFAQNVYLNRNTLNRLSPSSLFETLICKKNCLFSR